MDDEQPAALTIAPPSIAVGTPVWIANPSKDRKATPFVLAEVAANDEPLTLKLKDGAELQVASSAVDVANAISRFGEEERTETDNCALLNLSEATLLHNTKLRFLADDSERRWCSTCHIWRPPR